MAKPKLILTHQHGVPVSAKCSECGEEMPNGDPRVVTAEDNKKWFAHHFEQHLGKKHSREDFSQAAARIVKEATKER